MNIGIYGSLIHNLPVKQQSFTTQRATWKKVEEKFAWVEQINSSLFGNHSSLTISRQDIFDTIGIREAIIKIIYWGYPRGMRGTNMINLLKDIETIESKISELKKVKNPSIQDLDDIHQFFKEVKGIGLSTYSKILYFCQFSFNNNPCLILDQRLINVFSAGYFEEFHELSNINNYNKEDKYIDYIRVMKEIELNLKTQGDNIEQFLFLFGNNLKNTKHFNLK